MKNDVPPENKHKLVRRRASGRRGFTLTEIAIVAGVIGIIVGGLFAAFSTTRYHILLNQGVDEINITVGNMRSLYASRNASAVPTQAFGAALEQQLVAQKVFPSEMLITTGVLTYAYNPWDQTAADGSAQIRLIAAGGGAPAEFVIRYWNITPEVCTDLVVHNSAPGSDTGLVQITVNETTGAVAPTTYTAAANTLPVTSINAAAACPYTTAPVPAPIFNIDWYYTLGS